MEDVCIVCAEPLVFTAYGPCGHRDACSKCVLRLRTVIKDPRCVLCQQQCHAVFVTRAMGHYTAVLSADDWEGLPVSVPGRGEPVSPGHGHGGLGMASRRSPAHIRRIPGLPQDRVEAGSAWLLPQAQAYFDDQEHHTSMTELCSYSHPQLKGKDGGSISCSSLAVLRRLLRETAGLQFCELCLEGRKVFVGEQVLYEPKALDQHRRTGDAEGPLAEAGFRGHPECRFCRRRFYGDAELYVHMHTDHEQCFLCRRVEPTKHVYYRDYADLESAHAGPFCVRKGGEEISRGPFSRGNSAETPDAPRPPTSLLPPLLFPLPEQTTLRRTTTPASTQSA